MVVVIDLNGRKNHAIRKEVSDYVDARWSEILPRFGKAGKRGEESRKMEVKGGFLAQFVVRRTVGLAGIEDGGGDYSADLVSPHGVKIDVKTETVSIDFQEAYEGSGGVMRQAKHNFYPRQLYDPNLAKTNAFLVTRIRTGDGFPGRGFATEKRWKLWLCGWVSKRRVINEGVLVPRGGVTEMGSSFFAYRSHNVEFYQHALNPIDSLPDWFGAMTPEAVRGDEARNPDATRQCTTADAQRIISDLLAKEVISRDEFRAINRHIGLEDRHIPPILHSNHSVRLARYLINEGLLPESVLEKLAGAGIVETRPGDLDELSRVFDNADNRALVR